MADIQREIADLIARKNVILQKILKMDEELATLNQEQLDKEQHVQVWYSRDWPRDQKTGAMVFEVISCENQSSVPITDLMDLSNQTVEYDVVADAINQMLDVAKQYPNFRRTCICCKRKAQKAKILCWSCTGTYSPTVEAE